MAADEPMTLQELLAKFREIAPFLEQRAADVVDHHTAFTLQPGQTGLDVVRRGGHAFVLGAGILDFLCWAFDEPTKGYVPDDDARR